MPALYTLIRNESLRTQNIRHQRDNVGRFITTCERRGNVFGRICLSVCLSVCMYVCMYTPTQRVLELSGIGSLKNL